MPPGLGESYDDMAGMMSKFSLASKTQFKKVKVDTQVAKPEEKLGKMIAYSPDPPVVLPIGVRTNGIFNAGRPAN